MDYYESVVIDYLRTNRKIFLNTEYCIQVDPGKNPQKGAHWYCDALALDFSSTTIFLCEISYATNLGALIKRLRAWHQNWSEIRSAIVRDSALSRSSQESWKVRPWLFIPKDNKKSLEAKIAEVKDLLDPRITELETVQPWKYRPDWTDES